MMEIMEEGVARVGIIIINSDSELTIKHDELFERKSHGDGYEKAAEDYFYAVAGFLKVSAKKCQWHTTEGKHGVLKRFETFDGELNGKANAVVEFAYGGELPVCQKYSIITLSGGTPASVYVRNSLSKALNCFIEQVTQIDNTITPEEVLKGFFERGIQLRYGFHVSVFEETE